MTLQQADHIASYYSFLIGGTFIHHTYGECNLDTIEPFKMVSGTYTVVLKYDIYKAPCIPEFYEFNYPRKPLLKFLQENDIEFNKNLF